MKTIYSKRIFKHSITWLVVIVSILLTACGGGTPRPTASPLDTGISPLASPEVAAQAEPFQLDKPLIAGMTKITGSGPAEIPVIVADVTMGGEILGSTTISRNGRFEIELRNPLESAHRIGLTLGDFTGMGKQHEEFFDPAFYGDEAFQVPQVGFFFDTAMVRAQD